MFTNLIVANHKKKKLLKTAKIKTASKPWEKRGMEYKTEFFSAKWVLF